ncbi:MAG: queuosine precursor transporter [Alphaproteobacteria bacterium]
MQEIYAFAHALPPEAVWVTMLVTVYAMQLVLLRLFGADGLKLFIALAVIGAGVMVLKPVQFSIFPEPLALGTVLFVGSYLATDILNEHYGAAQARKAVWLGFAANLGFVLLMQLMLGFRPLTEETAGEAWGWALGMHPAMETLFAPAPAFLIAGFTAYLVSQHLDIWLYQKIREKTGKSKLWLRNNLSTFVSTLVDNTIFTVIAFGILAAQPVALSEMVTTYIIGAALMRWGIALFDTPFLYLAGKVVPQAARDDRQDAAPSGAVAAD